jgi:hypothetical protein
MELVGARLCHHIHYRPAGLAVFRSEEVRLHLELLHRINGGRVLQIRDAGVLLDSHDSNPVQQNVRGRIARTVGDEVRIVVAPAPARAHHPGR